VVSPVLFESEVLGQVVVNNRVCGRVLGVDVVADPVAKGHRLGSIIDSLLEGFKSSSSSALVRPLWKAYLPVARVSLRIRSISSNQGND
jgi:hypothetical protein